MHKSLYITIVFLISFSSLIGQSLDSYKYVLIPNQYEFQKSQDQYQINSLVKFLFNRAGYDAFLTSDELPSDLRNDYCLASKAFVEVIPSMLSVKTVVRLEDCFGKTILTTKVSRSKEKNYKKAYNESIRKNFLEIEKLSYNYNSAERDEDRNDEIVETKKKIVDKTKDKELVIKEAIADSKKEKIFKHLPIKEENEVKEKKKIKAIKEVKTTKQKKLGEPDEKIEMIKIKPEIINLIGFYEVGSWGNSEIVKKGDEYVIKGGDESIEVAAIYKTSKPNIYIIKWLAFKQPQLLQVDSNGTLKVDSKSGSKYYKRID